MIINLTQVYPIIKQSIMLVLLCVVAIEMLDVALEFHVPHPEERYAPIRSLVPDDRVAYLIDDSLIISGLHYHEMPMRVQWWLAPVLVIWRDVDCCRYLIADVPPDELPAGYSIIEQFDETLYLLLRDE